MMRRLQLASLGLFALMGVLVLQAQELPKTGSTEDPAKIKNKLTLEEQNLARRYAEFEQALLQLKQRMEKSPNPEQRERAAILGKALEKARDKSINVRFEQLVDLLKTQKLTSINQIQAAEKESLQLAEALREVLDLLRKDTKGADLREKAKSYEQMVKELERLIREEKAIRAQTERGQTEKGELARAQARVAEATAKLGKQMASDKKGNEGGEAKDTKADAKDAGKGEGKKGESKDAGKDGEGKQGASKEGGKAGDKEGKKSEAKGGESKSGQGNEPKEGKKTAEAKGAGESKSGKQGEAKAGEAKAGGKKSEAKGGEGKAGDPKKGDAKSDGAEKKAGDPKAGEAKVGGEKKAGDPKAGGDPKQGEPKAGGSKGGDPKQGEAKAGKSGSKDGKPSESKSGGEKSQSKPSEAKGGESKSGQGQPKSGGQPKEGEPSANKDNPKQPPQKPQEPQDEVAKARKRIQEAYGNEKDAEKKIQQGKNPDASKDQADAIKNLEAAKKKLEDLLRQIREEELERLLAALQARCEKMLAMQIRVLDGTVAVHKAIDNNGDKKATRLDQQNSLKLSDDEKEIVVEATKAIEMLEAEGSAVAFPEVFTQVREDMKHVQRRLGTVDTGKVTQAIEEDIISTLKEMIEALKKAQQQMDAKKNPPSGGGQSPPQTDQKLLDQIAELKMIRSMQIRVNDRTKLYGRQYEGQEQTNDANLRRELHDLSGRQERIFEVTNRIAKGDNR